MTSKHKENVPNHSEFPCNECNLNFGTNDYLEEHIQTQHSSAVACNYCGIPVDKNEYQDHMLEFHESTVIMYTIGKQVDELHEKMVDIETFKTNIIHTMNNLMNVQNEIKQELFLIRTHKTNDSNKAPELEKETAKVKNDKEKSSKTYASVTSKRRENDRNERRADNRYERRGEDTYERRSDDRNHWKTVNQGKKTTESSERHYNEVRRRPQNSHSYKHDHPRPKAREYRPGTHYYQHRPWSRNIHQCSSESHHSFPRFQSRYRNPSPPLYYDRRDESYMDRYPREYETRQQFRGPYFRENEFYLPTFNRFSSLGNY